MSINLKKSVWILLFSFCCIFLSESVTSEGKASGKIAEQISEEAEEDDIFAERNEASRRYLNVYIHGNFCMKIDILFIFGGLVLFFLIILERTQ